MVKNRIHIHFEDVDAIKIDFFAEPVRQTVMISRSLAATTSSTFFENRS